MQIDFEKEEMASKLRGSLMEFIKFFLKHITRRDYVESKPIGRESHQIIICRELTNIMRMKYPDENIILNVEPGSGKTLHMCMFIAWCMAHYPDSNFIYISYSHTLATAATSFVKQIMTSQMYAYLFGVEVSRDSRAKEHFATTVGGEVAAFGSEGSITGRNAGLPGLDRFSGAVIVDDAHKPGEAHSETIRERIIRNYEETIRQRPRGNNVPIIYMGQRVHEADLANFLIQGNDTKPCRKIILASLDEAENALYPEVHSKEFLLMLKEKSPYVFASQFQQNPLPAGGGLFKPDWFPMLPTDPEMLMTFITADTAETNKTWNDATVFSFWGLYDIVEFGQLTGQRALHWLDCIELRVEPRELRDAFMDFYGGCMTHPVKPLLAAIEKKSTGVTLVSALQEVRGLQIREVKRTRASGSKTERFLEMQPIIAARMVSFTEGARHAETCINHMSKITANDTHRFDDIADTAYDAVKIALIDKSLSVDTKQTSLIAATILQKQKSIQRARSNLYGGNQ